jgi:hypothetical protein
LDSRRSGRRSLCKGIEVSPHRSGLFEGGVEEGILGQVSMAIDMSERNTDHGGRGGRRAPVVIYIGFLTGLPRCMDISKV